MLYNEMTKQMRGPESNIMHCKDTLDVFVDVFVYKLDYSVDVMSNRDYQPFPLLEKQSAGTVCRS